MPAELTTVKPYTYDELMWWANNVLTDNEFNKYAEAAAQYGVGEEEALIDFINGMPDGLKVSKAADGSISGYFYQNVEQAVKTNTINSNVSTVSRGSLRQMVGQKFTDVGGVLKRNMVRYPASGGLGQKAAYLLGSAGSAYMAVSAGVALGKKISPLLYEAFPDYWNSIGLDSGSFDPSTWNGIINNDDSPFAGLFNFILGLDPETGESQMYVNQDMLAYMAYALKQNGWFSISGSTLNPDWMIDNNIASPIYYYDYIEYEPINLLINNRTYHGYLLSNITNELGYRMFLYKYNIDNFVPMNFYIFSYGNAHYLVSDTNLTNQQRYDAFILDSNNTPVGSGAISSSVSYKHNNKSCYRYSMPTFSTISLSYPDASTLDNDLDITAWSIVYGEKDIVPTIDGVSDQPNATLPDTSTWNDIPSTLSSLQNQYPDMFSNPMVWDNYADDGTPQQTTWVPIPMPDANSGIDTQPISGDQTQTSTNISNIPQTLIDLITQLVQQTQPQTAPEIETDVPPQNPIDTGYGDSPTPVVPTGTASALWSVYHPTQAQIDAFGGWLWSTDFVDQLLRVFENPMDAVVSLRKVFVMPVDAGDTTIAAGYLDSHVPSAYITQQYVYQDCGYVDCHEYFGNVFDYTNTHVSLYLPFIGIVPLNTAEVMRSTLHVIYGVDMFTGACLASVEVMRDANTVTMYQYSGNASVEYPLSGSRASAFLNGLMSLGGAALSAGSPVMAGGMAIHGIQQMATVSVQHSGGFSGNSGAMGIKKPYLIIERPQTKVAETFPRLAGYPTNYSCKLGECSNHVVVKDVHVEGINATQSELSQIEELLKSGVWV